MARNTRNYAPKDEKELRTTIRKLKAQVRNLTKEVKALKSENETLLDAWARTESFLSEITDGIPLEEMLKHRTLPKKAVRSHLTKVDQLLKEEESKEDFRKELAKWRKENL